jgi:hypothetical protein
VARRRQHAATVGTTTVTGGTTTATCSRATQQAAQRWQRAARQLQSLLLLHPGQVDLQEFYFDLLEIIWKYQFWRSILNLVKMAAKVVSNIFF